MQTVAKETSSLLEAAHAVSGQPDIAKTESGQLTRRGNRRGRRRSCKDRAERASGANRGEQQASKDRTPEERSNQEEAEKL
eukprot:2038628-Rhodomonas_salina.1